VFKNKITIRRANHILANISKPPK